MSVTFALPFLLVRDGVLLRIGSVKEAVSSRNHFGAGRNIGRGGVARVGRIKGRKGQGIKRGGLGAVVQAGRNGLSADRRIVPGQLALDRVPVAFNDGLALNSTSGV